MHHGEGCGSWAVVRACLVLVGSLLFQSSAIAQPPQNPGSITNQSTGNAGIVGRVDYLAQVTTNATYTLAGVTFQIGQYNGSGDFVPNTAYSATGVLQGGNYVAVVTGVPTGTYVCRAYAMWSGPYGSIARFHDKNITVR